MPFPDLQGPLALLEQKDFSTAVDVLERKVTALPAHLGAHVLLAYAYEAQRRWDRALEAWENARFLMPNSPIAEAGKRRVLRRMDGIEDDGERSPFADFLASNSPPAGPAETTSEAPPEALPEDAPDADEPEEMDDDSSATGDDFGLAQLRRLAEQEARQGGARPARADAPDLSSSPEESSTPEEEIERLDEEEDEADDLDRLIDELQSARIEPDPDAEMDAPPPTPDDPGAPPAEGEPSAEEPPGEEVVSETLAKIHAGQDDYQRAAHIFAQLAEQEPDRADEFREKAAEMREKAKGADDDA